MKKIASVFEKNRPIAKCIGYIYEELMSMGEVNNYLYASDKRYTEFYCGVVRKYSYHRMVIKIL